MFQFHEGPIKTPSIVEKSNQEARFQFHEGPIKTVVDGVDVAFGE